MDFEQLQSKYKKDIRMQDNFTNKDDIEYPFENDLVDIKVLNNNTKLLS